VRHAALALPLAVAALGGCREKVLPEPDFERMVRQEKYGLWAPCEHFPDGRAMQQPPPGTIALDASVGRPGYAEGLDGDAYLGEIPVPLSVPLVQRGRERFETFCAPCHGALADGASRVAAKMLLRRPPSLVGPEARAFPPGRVYQVITHGYGLMPAYAAEIASIDERWAVVAYLQALQRRGGGAR
jgi:mono/diheme cytochrome c family protein